MPNPKASLFSKLLEKPWILGLISGGYVLLFFYANNYSSINSWEHLGFFVMFFIGIPVVAFSVVSFLCNKIQSLQPYKLHAYVIGLITGTASLLSWAMHLRLQKKVLLAVLILSVIIAFKAREQYKKIAILILVMAIFPLFKNVIHIFEHSRSLAWQQLPDDTQDVDFVYRPNVYMIQPDGFVAQSVLEKPPYAMQSEIYQWLNGEGFKVYDNFRSNYPASLASNASMFAMRQHQFGEMVFPTLEVPNARDVIQGDNPVVKTFKRNGYKTHFIVEDEYFQQNRAVKAYDYHNIPWDTIPYFSDDDIIEKDVIVDLKKALEIQTGDPSFYFIERVLPHHVHFIKENRVNADKAWYKDRIAQGETFIKQAIKTIQETDDNALIIVLADHGGWAGINGFEEMYTTDDALKINSIYSTLAAIHWNGLEHTPYDTDLKSNVNVFRVLFAALASNKEISDRQEDNSSFNLRADGLFINSVWRVINDAGEVQPEKATK